MPKTPRRIQLSRRKGWRLPPNTVSVARPSKWGNPFRVGHQSINANHAVMQFRRDVEYFRNLEPVEFDTWIAPLRGKNLACWCREGDPCHGDVLLRLANL